MRRNACRDRFITSLLAIEVLEGRDTSVLTGNCTSLKKSPVEKMVGRNYAVIAVAEEASLDTWRVALHNLE